MPDEFLHNGRGNAGAFHQAGEGLAERVEGQFRDLAGAVPALFGLGMRAFWGQAYVGHELLELVGQGAHPLAALEPSLSGSEYVFASTSTPFRFNLCQPLEERIRDREDLPAAGFLGGQGEGGRLEVDRFPLERGDVAEPLAGVESSEDEAAPFALGHGQEFAELLHGEGAPFALAVRLAQGFDLGGRVLLDQAVPPRLLKRDPDDFELFVDRAGPNPGAYFVPEMGDVGGCAECEILVRPVTQGGDELGRGRLVFLQRGGRHRPLPETRPAGQVVLGRVRFKPPPRLGLVDVGDHPSRMGLGEVCF